MTNSERQIADAIGAAEQCAQPHTQRVTVALVNARVALRELDSNARRLGRAYALAGLRTRAQILRAAIAADYGTAHACAPVLERLASA